MSYFVCIWLYRDTGTTRTTSFDNLSFYLHGVAFQQLIAHERKRKDTNNGFKMFFTGC